MRIYKYRANVAAFGLGQVLVGAALIALVPSVFGSAITSLLGGFGLIVWAEYNRA